MDDAVAVEEPNPLALPAPGLLPAPAASLDPLVREASMLKGLVAAFAWLNKEAHLRLGNGELRMQSVDPSHCAMLRAEGPGPQGQETGLFVDTEQLSGALRHCDGAVILEHVPNDGRLLLRNQGVQRTVALLSSGTTDDIKVPVIELDNVVEVQQDAFLVALKHAEKLSDHIALAVGETFELRAEGAVDRLTRSFTGTSGGIVSKKRDSLTLVSLEYLTDFVKTIPKKTTITLGLCTDFPAQIQWRQSGIDYLALLAPRIEAEGEAAPTSDAGVPVPSDSEE